MKSGSPSLAPLKGRPTYAGVALLKGLPTYVGPAFRPGMLRPQGARL